MSSAWAAAGAASGISTRTAMPAFSLKPAFVCAAPSTDTRPSRISAPARERVTPAASAATTSRRSPLASSLDTLSDLLETLGSDLPTFFAKEDEKLVFGDGDIFVKEDPETLRGMIKWLIPSAQKNQMEPILVEMAAGGETEEDDPHEGEEFGYVLAGSVRIVLGDRVERARKGESFYLRPTAPRKLVNAGKGVCRVLWVSTPPSF